jgi:hypothetical protein
MPEYWHIGILTKSVNYFWGQKDAEFRASSSWNTSMTLEDWTTVCPFLSSKQRVHVSERVQASDSATDFSRRIREGR